MIRVRTLTLAAAVSLLACTRSDRSDVKDALGDAKPYVDTLCLVANQALPDEDALRYCKVVGPLIDFARSFLATSRTVTQQQVAATLGTRGATPCATNPDAGAGRP